MREKFLDGKVAIVTGAAGGIGSAYSRALAEAGATVVLADLDADRTAAVAQKLSAEGLAAVSRHLDVTGDESTEAMGRWAKEEFGRVDILVNNAALMAEITSRSVLTMDMEMWQRVLDVNVTGPLRCVRAVAPLMREQGYGKIINQVSGGAFMAGGGSYGTSKLALVYLTTHLAHELASDGVRVNAIAPGWVKTEAGLRASSPGARERIAQTVPFPFGEPTDLTGTLLFLCSADSDWMTGQTLNVDGGWIHRL